MNNPTGSVGAVVGKVLLQLIELIPLLLQIQGAGLYHHELFLKHSALSTMHTKLYQQWTDL